MISKSTTTKQPVQLKLFYMLGIFFICLIAVIPFAAIFKLDVFMVMSVPFVLIGLPAYLYLYLQYNFFSFSADDEKLTINSGVIMQGAKVLNYASISSVDFQVNPITRLFNLGQIRIWSASPAQLVTGAKALAKPEAAFYLSIPDGKHLQNILTTKKFDH